jgi:DNA polymerase III epsilon subunit-like protein
MKNNTIIVFDFETGSLDINKCEVIQVAAMAIDRKNLEPIPNAVFESLIKPRDFNNLQDEALAINKKTREELKQAPNIEVVWKKFIDFLAMFNVGKSQFTAPIPAGKNIRYFDMPIFERICNELKYVDKNGNQTWFNKRKMYDLDEIMLLWFENSTDLPNMKMDTIRDYFGMSKAGAHDALVDVKQTTDLITHFLKLHRSIYPKIKFKDSFRK